MFTICIGICVYNEENNIKNLLESLLTQKTKQQIKEIIIVSSACSDKTDEIIENEFLKSYPEIILLKQEKREGKASAINLLLEHSSSEIVVLESGDTIPIENTIEKLVEPFKNEKTGMTGGHPIPTNDPNTFIGFAVHLLWRLHHKLALNNPKLGELVAFRKNLIKKIPEDTAVDEASIEARIKEQGYELKYVPDAIVYNKGPESISDFLKQRRRIFTGHIHLKKTKGYSASSMNKLDILKLAIEDVKLSPKEILLTFGSIILELYGRVLGSYDFFIKKENPFIWNTAKTTKNVFKTTEKFNRNMYPVPSAANRIRLWSRIGEEITVSKPQTLNEKNFLPNIHLKPGLSSSEDTKNFFDLKRDLTEENMEELKDEKNI